MRDTTNTYEFNEFPKWLYPDAGEPVLVNDEDEEAAAIKIGSVPPREPDERARLIKIAEIKDVQIDKRWSLDRLANAITDAGFDPSVNPFE